MSNKILTSLTGRRQKEARGSKRRQEKAREGKRRQEEARDGKRITQIEK